MVTFLDHQQKRCRFVERVLTLVGRSGVRGHASDPDHRPHAALMRDDNRVRGRLADDTQVDFRPVGNKGARAAACDFLVHHKNGQQRARPAITRCAQHPNRFDHCGDRSLGIAGATPEQPAVFASELEGIGRPTAACRNDVHMRIEREDRPWSIIESRHHIRTPLRDICRSTLNPRPVS